MVVTPLGTSPIDLPASKRQNFFEHAACARVLGLFDVKLRECVVAEESQGSV